MKTADEEAKEQARAQLAYWQQQAAMTDEQILKVYCDEKRRFAIGQVNMIQKHMAEDAKVEEEIRLYGEIG